MKKILASIFLINLVFLLSGCANLKSLNTTTLKNQVKRANQVLDRTSDFVKSAPTAPCQAMGDYEVFKEQVEEYNLELNGQQLQLIQGAAQKINLSPVLLALVIEQELRWLDDNELERDILSALAGEDSSIGIAQVRLSTAGEIESSDIQDLFPDFDNSDNARTERIRRLASDDWSVLYAAAYLALIQQYSPNESAFASADRYTGRNPQNVPTEEQESLYAIFQEIFNN